MPITTNGLGPYAKLTCLLPPPILLLTLMSSW